MSDIPSFRSRDTIFTSTFRGGCKLPCKINANRILPLLKTHYQKRRSKIVSLLLHDVPFNFRFTRFLPNARTAFTSDLFKKIPSCRDFHRYLSFFRASHSLLHRFFLAILSVQYVHDQEFLTRVLFRKSRKELYM